MLASAACYSLTFSRLLTQAALPTGDVDTTAGVEVTGFPTSLSIACLIVSPTIIGGDSNRMPEYEAAAQRARERCFIGRHLSREVAYSVGNVRVA